MCAIAGMVNLSCDKQILDKMLASMSHRGPDETGIFQGRDCALLHSRLAIIDLAGGKQPMTLQCVGERYTLVYNGELYNTHEVRQELRTLGHSFSGHSDTEVVLHAYAQWGQACLEQFNGIFAFASYIFPEIYDKINTQRAVLRNVSPVVKTARRVFFL